MKKITKLFIVTILIVSTNFLNAQCYTPLYPKGNLCPDPEMTDLALWNGWGAKREVVQSSGAYCGDKFMKLVSNGNAAGCAWPGTNGEDSALDINLTWEKNAKYRLHVWVKTVGGSIGFLAKGTNPDVSSSYDTSGNWQLIDLEMVTGAAAVAGFISFNTCDGGATATEINLDNYELYRIDNLGLNNVSSVISTNINAVGSKIFITNVDSPTEISVYSMTGALVESFKTDTDTDFNFKSGLWIVKIKTTDGEKSVKIVIN
ncbi:T9SS type A sorting domain-containing protein [Flavobacterium cellulosilyticum]|uniref:T9SS type A sorting domain-containing protein n=1 Tax=Flavobacterium cellulosilyticum TaxID=2541731 RepID=A0A4R5C5Q0_9FLAO|nr:T9SS type A sorting domain-containing protein [Flavobacterium cellulosilyticum]TDD93836.1 T9SS type A sorting domain-containing protein [Flavobacterium cellulosilyticum]